MSDAMNPAGTIVHKNLYRRLSTGQTAVDYVGRRRTWLAVSVVLVVAPVISLLTQGLNLGIDFRGGVSWDVPAASGFSTAEARRILVDHGVSTEGARIQERTSTDGENIVKVQVEDQPEEVAASLRAAFADAAGVTTDAVNVNLVSSTWGSAITSKAIRALVIFVIIVSIFISLRFEWKMALASIVAMFHDVLVSVGIYSIFQFIVTPPTVIAFLTILGYSLYDTIVVFDRIKENEARFAGRQSQYDDIVNVSVNQVLMRSLMTSFSSVVPVLSLLLIGAGVLGQSTLAEFGLALLIGMVTGVYSSIFVASPLLAWLHEREQPEGTRRRPRATGEELRRMVMAGSVTTRRRGVEPTVERVAESGIAPAAARSAPSALTHPPRPRKKKRR